MAARTGRADLPLHGGHVPPWLATRMAALGRVLVEALVVAYGRDEVLRRLASPFWFQCFGAVMGMDWHSSGITTSVIGALRRGLEPVADELGLHVCGGRGRRSRATPGELLEVAARTGLDGDALARTSRLVASVDSAALQDGYQIYLHAFIVTDDGRWTVVQQGMNDANGYARRYHWLSEGLESFVAAPHAALDGVAGGELLNLTDTRAGAARQRQLALVGDGPDRAVGELRLLARSEPHLRLPRHHAVRAADLRLGRLHAALAAAHEAAPRDFESLLLVPGVGARTVEALALLAEVLFGAPSRFDDPARFSYALGGKDGHPFPVPLDVYDATLTVLRDAVGTARLGRGERLAAVRRLDTQARALDGRAGGPPWSSVLAEQRARMPALGGRRAGGGRRSGTTATHGGPRQIPLI